MWDPDEFDRAFFREVRMARHSAAHGCIILAALGTAVLVLLALIAHIIQLALR